MGAMDGSQRTGRCRKRVHVGGNRRSGARRLPPVTTRAIDGTVKGCGKGGMRLMAGFPEYVDGLPNICGAEDQISAAVNTTGRIYLPQSGVDFARMKSAFAVALHMHQPLIPAGGDNLRSAAIISNLKQM